MTLQSDHTLSDLSRQKQIFCVLWTNPSQDTETYSSSPNYWFSNMFSLIFFLKNMFISVKLRYLITELKPDNKCVTSIFHPLCCSWGTEVEWSFTIESASLPGTTGEKWVGCLPYPAILCESVVLPRATYLGCVCKFTLAIYSRKFRALWFESIRAKNNWWIYKQPSTVVMTGVSKHWLKNCH